MPSNKLSSRPGENVAPKVAVARLIRSQALLAVTRTESTGHFSPIVDNLTHDEQEGDTLATLPDDMAEDDQAASEGAPPSQSPRTQLASKRFRKEAAIAEGYYGVDVTAGPDSSAMEDERIEEIDDKKDDSEYPDELHAETVDNLDSTQYHTEDLVPDGSIKIRRKREPNPDAEA